MFYTNIYYFYYLSDIGGTETFLYQLAKKYKQYDLTVIYRYANDNQVKRLKQYVRCVQFTGQEIKCKRAFFNYGIDIIDKITAEDYCFVIHADYEDLRKRGQLTSKIPNHPKINKWIAVSQRAADGFYAVTGKRPIVSYNPFTIEKPEKILNLISATRLSKEKGGYRIYQLTQMLDAAHIRYTWTIYTNDRTRIDNPSIIYKKPTLDILPHIANSDYLVQLSDNEGYCYSVIEALTAGVPVIVTPCPVFDELGIIDGVNCYKIPFDMKNFDVKKLLNIPKNFNYTPPQDSWDELLIKEPSVYLQEREKRYLVQALPTYQQLKLSDAELGIIPSPGKQWEVSHERMKFLTGDNPKKKKFVKIVKEILSL